MVRVIKHYNPDRIAAEILNQVFAKEYLQWDGHAIVFNPAGADYPVRKVGITTYRIVSTYMFVFVDETRKGKCESAIKQSLDVLADMIPNNLRQSAGIYEIVEAHSATNPIKGPEIKNGKFTKSGIVIFGDATRSNYGERFRCVITTYKDFDLKLSSEFPNDTMGKYGCGLYVDEYDTLTIADNECVWQFPETIFRSHGKTVELSEWVTLTAGNALTLQLHPYKDVYATDYAKMRDRLNKPVRVGQRDWFKLEAPTISLESKTCSDKLCARCRGVLYDECYVLWKQASAKAIALHPTCLHCCPSDAAIEDEFDAVFRVSFPISAADIAVHSDNIVQDVMQQALKSCKRIEYVLEGVSIVYYLIGDKYVYFMHEKDYQFRACMLPQIRDRVPLRNVVIITAE